MQGKAYVIDWGKNIIGGRKAFQYMLEQLGGFQSLLYTLCSDDQEVTKTPEEIDAGFDFIEESAPRSHQKNAQLRWVTKQANDKASPVYVLHSLILFIIPTSCMNFIHLLSRSLNERY